MTTVRIDRVPASDAADPALGAAGIAELIAVAFEALPVSAWLVPDPAARVTVLTYDFQLLAEYALEHGQVHVTSEGAAVALWLPDDAPPPEPAEYDARLLAATGEWVDRFRALHELFESHHPPEPHHHLAFLAVHPDRQGTGLGTALLSHHHRNLDAMGLPAYVEASSPGSRALYARHGYRELGEPFKIPTGAPFWPMWRPPAGAQALPTG